MRPEGDRVPPQPADPGPGQSFLMMAAAQMHSEGRLVQPASDSDRDPVRGQTRSTPKLGSEALPRPEGFAEGQKMGIDPMLRKGYGESPIDAGDAEFAGHQELIQRFQELGDETNRRLNVHPFAGTTQYPFITDKAGLPGTLGKDNRPIAAAQITSGLKELPQAAETSEAFYHTVRNYLSGVAARTPPGIMITNDAIKKFPKLEEYIAQRPKDIAIKRSKFGVHVYPITGDET